VHSECICGLGLGKLAGGQGANCPLSENPSPVSAFHLKIRPFGARASLPQQCPKQKKSWIGYAHAFPHYKAKQRNSTPDVMMTMMIDLKSI